MALTKAHHRMIQGPVIALEDFGIVDDDSTDNGTALRSLESHIRNLGGATVVSEMTGIIRTSKVFVCPPNLTWDVRAKLYNTGTSGTWDSYGVLYGQCNREDIARSKGVEETAHDAGTLVKGAVELTVGNRWNNTASSFTNARTYTPQVGDLCVVATTDDTQSDPTRPVPSFTHHRKILHVSGTTVTLDKGVGGAGNYMIIPTSRGLGFDRTTYNGVGRMETIENVRWYGDVESQNNFPMLTGGVIDFNISGEFSGRACVYGNGARNGDFNVTGIFTRNACEQAIGTEDITVNLDCSHRDAGQTYTVACVQFGERPIGATLGRVRVSAPAWNGDDALLIVGNDCGVHDAIIETACTGRLVAVGSSLTSADRFYSNRLDVSSSGSMIDRLLQLKNADDIVFNAILRGNTSNADAAIFESDSSGRVEKIDIVDDNGTVRINGDYLIGEVEASGTISTVGSRASRERIKPKITSSYINTVSFASPYTPTGDFSMVLTGNLTLNFPSGDFEDGDTISMIFQQDGTGGHTISYAGGANYRGFTLPSAGTASKRFTITFKKSSTVFICVATNGDFYS